VDEDLDVLVLVLDELPEPASTSLQPIRPVMTDRVDRAVVSSRMVSGGRRSTPASRARTLGDHQQFTSTVAGCPRSPR